MPRFDLGFKLIDDRTQLDAGRLLHLGNRGQEALVNLVVDEEILIELEAFDELLDWLVGVAEERQAIGNVVRARNV